MTRLWLAAGLAVTLSACAQQYPHAVQPSGFAASSGSTNSAGAARWAPGYDVSGFYRPAIEIDNASWRIDHVFVGMPEEFDAWRAQGSEPYAVPLWIEFHATDGPARTNAQGREAGREMAGERTRVHAQSFTLAPGRFAFRGANGTIGEVVLSGRIDAHTPGRRGRATDDPAALRADTSIGNERVGEIVFVQIPGE
ncbi:hypothetical protein GCM10011367_23780 [Marinicauda pacifica]|uniref:Uncharacterized protein n=1 Tax=Marinicauda pacifica TaxID=1133559 RepID=A0A4S2H974_9PROT|nr:hypothetical protein [Marinicauda pacifica]TGY92356.1 hypothetical protein E5162_11970 [Marinicauda pacifica]GGE48187.1 hypothetical protein GCM10011367_23780 [Marinicauda pacifica]